MSIYNGEKLKIEIYGSSHAEAIGVKIWGLPEGFELNEAELQSFLDRRAPGARNSQEAKEAELSFDQSILKLTSTSRREPDKVKILKGLSDGKLTGREFQAEIKNLDVKSEDYDELKTVPRPGHSDYAQYLKNGKILPGGGEYSGRMTAPLCIAGGIVKQILEQKGICIKSDIYEIGGEYIESKMTDKILEAREKGDSVGGVIQCMAEGLEAGIGGPMFERFEAGIARMVFSIPAVKGVEFGQGFGTAKMLGSENNDSFIIKNEKIMTRQNNHGGVLGGVTTGMPLIVKVAIKPTPSISISQMSVDLETKEQVEIKVEGRHDTCIVPRALAPVEAAVAIAIYDRI